MKVAYITTGLPLPSETFACEEVRTLHEMDVDLTVFGLSPRHADFEQLVQERNLAGVAIDHATFGAVVRGLLLCLLRLDWSLPLVWLLLRTEWRRPRQILLGLFYLPRSLDVFQKLQRMQPDVVHLFWGHYPALVGHLVKRRLPSSVVLSISLAAFDLRRRFGPSRSLAPKCDLVWTISRENVSKIATMGVAADGILVRHRGVRQPQVVSARDPKRFVSVGRLVSGKGMDDVVSAFAKIHAKDSETRLLVLGDGPQRSELQHQIERLKLKDSVELRGHVTHDDVFDTLSKSSVLLFLSEMEVLPNVVKEAMAVGTLPVVSATEGIEELLQNGLHGYVVPMNDPRVAAERVLEILDRPADHQPMREAAIAHIQEHFSLEHSTRKLIDRWQDAIEAKCATSAGVYTKGNTAAR